MTDHEIGWFLLYTKPRAERWAEINLRNQGFATLLPLVRGRSGFVPLFSRYLFVGCRPEQRIDPLASTRGVLYIVHVGDRPARVPHAVVAQVRERMDARGCVAVEPPPAAHPLFSGSDRERIRTLVKLADAGFRVVA
jgi:transcriptional antiterminator RfaH